MNAFEKLEVCIARLDSYEAPRDASPVVISEENADYSTCEYELLPSEDDGAQRLTLGDLREILASMRTEYLLHDDGGVRSAMGIHPTQKAATDYALETVNSPNTGTKLLHVVKTTVSYHSERVATVKANH